MYNCQFLTFKQCRLNSSVASSGIIITGFDLVAFNGIVITFYEDFKMSLPYTGEKNKHFELIDI